MGASVSFRADTQRFDDISREQQLARIEAERLEKTIEAISVSTAASSPQNGDGATKLPDDLRLRLAELGIALEAQHAELAVLEEVLAKEGVAESVYNPLRQGASAEFRANNDSRIFRGTVSRLAGPGAQALYANLAIAPSEWTCEDLNEYECRHSQK